MNWQPIETAPKDGTQVLVYGNGSYSVAYFYYGEWRDVGDIGWAGMHGDGNQPTHWAPLFPPDNAQHFYQQPPGTPSGK